MAHCHSLEGVAVEFGGPPPRASEVLTKRRDDPSVSGKSEAIAFQKGLHNIEHGIVCTRGGKRGEACIVQEPGSVETGPGLEE
jgi:hypothetical protein